jgi:hypothetical protein
MSRDLAATGASLLVGSVVSAVLTLALLTVWARVHYARRLPSFRCRIGPPPAGGRRRRGARWCLRRSWATWVDDVLLVRSGALRLWLTPLPVSVARDVTVQALRPGEVRGLGRRPVALRLTLRDDGELEIAVAAESAERLVGPFLTAALSGLPDAPRERGG